ncbi:MAG: glycogen debranching protein GlgX [Pontiellaceae bacterium]|jgi:glycogen operon protein|nr:glycogen debranching protein GlgX [Pontiellaceae bacterium]
MLSGSPLRRADRLPYSHTLKHGFFCPQPVLHQSILNILFEPFGSVALFFFEKQTGVSLPDCAGTMDSSAIRVILRFPPVGMVEFQTSRSTLQTMKPGIHIRNNAIDFIVHSRANRLWLLLFDAADDEAPSRKIEMTPGENHLWHTSVPGIKPGVFYLYRTDAFPDQWLLDPYARAVYFPRAWGETDGHKPGQHIRTGRLFPKGIVIEDTFNWGRKEKRPGTPLEKTILYEAHLRGFTRAEADGTYLDFIKKIPYLKSLGITAVEFLPLFEFNELEFFIEGADRKHLLNYWGYSTLSFFAPMSRYAASKKPGAAVDEFKTLVKALHAADIEIILDVVLNHTAEGPFNGPVYNFRGLDEAAYYMISHDGTYPNWSGCGNTFNCNHPVAAQLIVDCLTYWAEEMHVDGFRFDLATVLCRGAGGELLDQPPVIRAIESSPALKKVKLIAEAWDALGGYQVGNFPGKRFSDWNGCFRDDIRSFWNEGDTAGNLATRLAGSSDLYKHNGSSPLKSINFVTAHDGFTLADLVTYERKYNEANCEQNRDGENCNYSANFGFEGPLEEPAICARRLKQQKNLLATLFLSRGVPMLNAGDEFGRTQLGNNNAYCQDSELSWINWTLVEKNKNLLDFTRNLIGLRKKHFSLHIRKFYTGRGDVEWIGAEGRPVHWQADRAIGMNIKGADPLLLLFNNEAVPLSFTLPKGKWKLALSTDPDTVAPAYNDHELSVPPNSVCVLTPD